MTRINYIDLAPLAKRAKHAKDRHNKDIMVVHETVSHDAKGTSDIMGVAKNLLAEGYFIHGITDEEGHKAWSYGYATSEFIHCGGVNERACGIEQVSWIPAMIEKEVISKTQAYEMWMRRTHQLSATALLVAAWHNADPKNRPLKFSDGLHPGVTSHWNVSQHFAASEGHFDCWPHHLGGYYPLLHVIDLAKVMARHGYTF